MNALTLKFAADFVHVFPSGRRVVIERYVLGYHVEACVILSII